MTSEPNVAEDLADKLRERILSGELQSGDQLPGEQRLGETYGVSRDSVRRALSRLESESLVETVGRARYVRRYEVYEWRPDKFEHRRYRRDEPGTGQDAFTADVAAQGREASQVVDLAFVPLPDKVTGFKVAEYLGLEPGTTVVVRRRRRDIDGVPYHLADSYYPMFVAQDSKIMEPGDVVVPGGLMKDAGYEQVRYHDVMGGAGGSWFPTQEECVRLRIPKSTPVFRHCRVGYDANDTPVRVIISVLPVDRHMIIYDVEAR